MSLAGVTRLIVGGCLAALAGGPCAKASTVLVVDSSDSAPDITVIGATSYASAHVYHQL